MINQFHVSGNIHDMPKMFNLLREQLTQHDNWQLIDPVGYCDVILMIFSCTEQALAIFHVHEQCDCQHNKSLCFRERDLNDLQVIQLLLADVHNFSTCSFKTHLSIELFYNRFKTTSILNALVN